MIVLKTLRIALIPILLSWSFHCGAQQMLSLDTCQQRARDHYPLLAQMDLLARSSAYSLENAAKGWYPQVSIQGQASYKSAVTEVPISLPGLDIPGLSKDQYRLFADVSQPIYEGGMIRLQQQGIRLNQQLETQKTEVELYKLRERVLQLFFGILLIEDQLAQAELLGKDIRNSLGKMRAAISEGVALRSSADALEAEEIKLGQRITELQTSHRGYLDMLGAFIQADLKDDVVLQRPEPITGAAVINRPESRVFTLQRENLLLQRQMLDARILPKASLFLQAGLGRPGLNMLDNSLAAYWIGGLRFNWPLNALYTAREDKALLDLNRQMVEVQEQTFLFNTDLSLRQQNRDLLKYEQLLRGDQELIRLRNKIRLSAQAQLENGVITASDYLRELNAEDQARQNLALHRTQWLMGQYQLHNTSGQ